MIKPDPQLRRDAGTPQLSPGAWRARLGFGVLSFALWVWMGWRADTLPMKILTALAAAASAVSFVVALRQYRKSRPSPKL